MIRDQILGKPTAAEKFMGMGAVAAAAFTALTLKLNLFQHPKLTRRAYPGEASFSVTADVAPESQGLIQLEVPTSWVDRSDGQKVAACRQEAEVLQR